MKKDIYRHIMSCMVFFGYVFTCNTAFADLPFKVKAKSAVLINAVSGQIVYEHGADKQLPPASLTKLMTLYLALEAVDNGYVEMSDLVLISKKAWQTGGSKMFVNVGKRVIFETLLEGISVVSANDGCVAISEHIAGVEEAFVDRMNKKAQALGMKKTLFKNSHGLPAEGQIVTAHDIALLSCAYINNFPEALKRHSIKEMIFNGIKQPNRNGLLWLDFGVDGLKTGWFKKAGYHIVATAGRNGDRFISVVMGSKGETQRENIALQLLSYGFKNFKTIMISEEKTRAETELWNGRTGKVFLETSEKVCITIPTEDKDKLYIEKDFPEMVFAPVKKGAIIGELRIFVGDRLHKTLPLVATQSIDRAGLIKRAFHGIILFFKMPPYTGYLILAIFSALVVFIGILLRFKKKNRRNIYE